MAKVTIKNRVKQDEAEKLARDTQNNLVLQYLKSYYPWIKVFEDNRYTIFAKDKSWGYICGAVCEISQSECLVVVDVVGEALATQEFADFLQTVYGDKDVVITVVHYKDKERERMYGGFY